MRIPDTVLPVYSIEGHNVPQAAARRARVEANRSASCPTCPSLNVAACPGS